ncbi:response regulator [Candidatus Peregrinibacteria bacterium]|nr:response regulator [Candidatus Peregrinibacteria bacterium]
MPQASTSASTSTKKRVLIVEDERPLAHALELKVGHEGYETHVCLTGADGLKEALTGSYDCILLDLIMPEMDGFSLLQEIVAKKVKTPVIVLSNLGQEEDKAKAKSFGVVDYFVKANTPIADIVKRVRGLLA